MKGLALGADERTIYMSIHRKYERVLYIHQGLERRVMLHLMVSCFLG